MSNGRPFSDDDVRTITGMYLDGKSLTEIAAELGRSQGSISFKLSQLRRDAPEIRKGRLKTNATANTIHSFARRHNIPFGSPPSFIKNANMSFEFKEWLFERSVKNGFDSVLEMMFDEMLDIFYEEQKNEGKIHPVQTAV